MKLIGWSDEHSRDEGLFIFLDSKVLPLHLFSNIMNIKRNWNLEETFPTDSMNIQEYNSHVQMKILRTQVWDVGVPRPGVLET